MPKRHPSYQAFKQRVANATMLPLTMAKTASVIFNKNKMDGAGRLFQLMRRQFWKNWVSIFWRRSFRISLAIASKLLLTSILILQTAKSLKSLVIVFLAFCSHSFTSMSWCKRMLRHKSCSAQTNNSRKCKWKNPFTSSAAQGGGGSFRIENL